MARIVGGIGTSHAPSIAYAYDRDQEETPAWRPLFEGYRPAREWLAAARPDVIVAFYNDHMNRFFFDAYPTLALGVGERHAIADEGWGQRDFPDLAGHPLLAWHLAEHLIEAEFDLTVCQEMLIDHGILSPLPLLSERPWPAPVIPFAINVIQHPLPSPRRCFKLGQALRRAIESYPEDLRVVVMGTGGLSHQTSGPGFGFVNPDWDENFLRMIAERPEALLDFDHAELMALGGAEGVEVIIWLAMRGALESRVRVVHRNYYAPMLTGYGLLVLEDEARSPAAKSV